MEKRRKRRRPNIPADRPKKCPLQSCPPAAFIPSFTLISSFGHFFVIPFLLLGIIPLANGQWAQPQHPQQIAVPAYSAGHSPIAQQQQQIYGQRQYYGGGGGGVRTAQMFQQQQQQPSAQEQRQQAPIQTHQTPQQQQPQNVRHSRYDPMLKVKSFDGYLPASAGPGTFVRIAPSVHAPPLQILVEDRDLQPGMPSAVYQYVLTGYGAEWFAVDQHGNLYLADALDLDESGASSFELHVMAREVDTFPKRDSQPISLTIHVLDDEHVAPISNLAQTIYMANVSAWDASERVIAQVKAREGEKAGNVQYRIIEVSDGAKASFRYDDATNELLAVGPLYPGHRYKVVIEARDSEGLVGHAIVLVQALPPVHLPSPGNFPLPPMSPNAPSLLVPAKPPSSVPDNLALIPAELLGAVNLHRPSNGAALSGGALSTQIPHIQPMIPHPPHILAPGTTMEPPPSMASTVHPTEQTIFVELSELVPARTLVTTFGDENTLGKVYFLLTGGNERGKFVVEEDSGNVLTSGPMDREEAEKYTLRIEARSRAPFDQLLYVTNLHVNIVDANDNAPQFVGSHPLVLSTRLEQLLPDPAAQFTQSNLLLGKVQVLDPDKGENGRVSLRVLPPLDRLFTVNDAGEVRINGLLSAAHLGEHHLTIMAVDHGQPAQESRAVLIVRIDGHLPMASNLRETLAGQMPPSLSPFGLLAISGPGPSVPPSIVQPPAPSNGHSHSSASGASGNSADYESAGGDKIGAGDNSAGFSGTGLESALERHENGKGGSAALGIGGDGDESGADGFSSAQLPLNRRPSPESSAAAFTRLNPQIIGANGLSGPTQANVIPPSTPIVEPVEPISQPTNTEKVPSSQWGNGGEEDQQQSAASANVIPEKTWPAAPNGVEPIEGEQQEEEEEPTLPPAIAKQLPIRPIPKGRPSSVGPSKFSSSTAPSANFPPTSKSSSSSSSLEEAGPRLAPIFEAAEQRIFVEENEEQMELIKLKARYPDGGPGPIKFVLLAGDQSLFSVNSTSGQVILLKALDAESDMQPPIYRLRVGTEEAEKSGDGELLKDPGLAHSCELTIHVIDMNDWIPNFEQDHYDFGISATAEQGTVLGQVTAFDQDLTAPNNKIHYRILPPSESSETDSSAIELFRIDQDTGQITVANAKSMEEFAGHRLEFRVEAMDGGIDGTELNSTAGVTVHVEGNRPETKLPEAKLPETKLPSSTESVVEQNQKTQSMNLEETLKSKESSTLPTSSTSKTSKGKSSESPAISNPKPPLPPLSSHPAPNAIQFVSHQFNSSVMEGARPPVLVQTLEIKNKPRDTRFTICAIRDGNYRSAFSVAPNAEGNCELRTEIQLDRETVDHYRLNISVENGGQVDWTMANVTVLDANDNKPKFVFPRGGGSGEGHGAASFFAVLPVETGANEKFFRVKAEDADGPGTGNSLVTFELDNQTVHSEQAQYFGIDAKTGDIWPRKKTRELVQLMKKNNFVLTIIACDNPGEPKRRFCSRAPVAISLLDDQHRFVLIFIGISPEKIRLQEKDLVQSLRPFTLPCSNPSIERIEELPEASENGQSLVQVRMYAANLKERKLCLRQEIHKIFTQEAKEALTIAMRQWGAELLDIVGVEEASRNAARKNTGIGIGSPASSTDPPDGLAALLFPIDWNNASTVLIAIGIGIALIALVGLCALFLFRARHKQMRRRAEQMRRRHHHNRGGFNAAGLLAINGAKGPQHMGPMNGAGPGVFAAAASGLPSSYAASSNISNNLYMPSATPLGSGGPNFERGNKFYESQMLELPIVDADMEFMGRTNPLLANENGRNGVFPNGHHHHHPNCANGYGGHGIVTTHRHRDGDALLDSSSSKSSPDRRHYSSGLLPPPPPPSQRQPATTKGGGMLLNGRRNDSNNAQFPHCIPGTSAAASNSGIVMRRHNTPPGNAQNAHQHHNQQGDGDFSIDESFYVANGQSRYHFH